MTVLLSALLYECDAALLGGDLRSPEGRHDVLREPTELVGEFRGRQSFSPVDHEILKPRVLGFDRLYAIDDLGRGPAEPGLLLHAVANRGDRRRRTGSAPGAAPIVGIAHEAERHPDIDRQVLGPRHHRDVLQPIASVVDGRRTLEVLALEVESFFIEALQQELKLLL